MVHEAIGRITVSTSMKSVHNAQSNILRYGTIDRPRKTMRTIPQYLTPFLATKI